MDKQKALRKGLDNQPTDHHGALSWLYQMFALLKSMFTKDLPELAHLQPEEGEPAPIKQPFTVVAWTTEGAFSEYQLDKLEGKLTDDEVEVYWEKLDSEEIHLLGHRTSEDPADVDLMIAVMSERYKGVGRLTLSGPGVALRLNRKARRAAMSRAKRFVRRAKRAEARDRKLARKALIKAHGRAKAKAIYNG